MAIVVAVAVRGSAGCCQRIVRLNVLRGERRGICIVPGSHVERPTVEFRANEELQGVGDARLVTVFDECDAAVLARALILGHGHPFNGSGL